MSPVERNEHIRQFPMNDNRTPLCDLENRPTGSWLLQIVSAIVLFQLVAIGVYIHWAYQGYYNQSLTINGKTFAEDLVYHINKELTK